MTELIAAGAWILHRSSNSYWLLGILLLAFTVVYTAHVLTAGAPDCGCLGKLQAFAEWKDSVTVVLIRNSVLMCLWVIGGLASRATGRSVQRVRPVNRHSMSERGYSLIEMLVTISLVGILIALLAPSLSGFRTKAADIGSLATIRSHSAVFTSYAVDNRDYFPSLVDPRATSATYTVGGRPYIISGYFGQVHVWHFGLSSTYYDHVIAGPLFQRPGNDANTLMSDFRYSASFMADPAYWKPETRIGPSQWRAQRAAVVRFPSAKALLADDRVMLRGSNASAAIALTDGSARQLRLSDMTTPMRSGEGDFPGTFNLIGSPGIHTLEGVFGRDIK